MLARRGTSLATHGVLRRLLTSTGGSLGRGSRAGSHRQPVWQPQRGMSSSATNDIPSLGSYIAGEFSAGRGAPVLLGTLGLASAALILERWTADDSHGAAGHGAEDVNIESHHAEKATEHPESAEIVGEAAVDVVPVTGSDEGAGNGVDESASLSKDESQLLPQESTSLLETSGDDSEEQALPSEKVEEKVEVAGSEAADEGDVENSSTPEDNVGIEEIVESSISEAVKAVSDTTAELVGTNEESSSPRTVEDQEAEEQQVEQGGADEQSGSTGGLVSDTISKSAEAVSDLIEGASEIVGGGLSEKEDAAVTQKTEGEEEDKDECPFCQFMKGGPCREEFIAWDACVDAARTEGSEVFDHCLEPTFKMKICMEAHKEYYGPVLDAEMEVAKEEAENAPQEDLKTTEDETKQEQQESLNETGVVHSESVSSAEEGESSPLGASSSEDEGSTTKE